MIIQGTIQDEKGRLLIPAQLVFVVKDSQDAAGHMQEISERIELTDGTYAIDTANFDADTDAINFISPGKKSRWLSFQQLASHPTVILGNKFPIGLFLAGAGVAYVLSDSKKKIGELNIEKAGGIVVIGAGVLAFVLIKELLEKLGVWDDKDSVSLDNASTNPNSFWNPVFWQTKPASTSYTRPITLDQAKQYAAFIYDATGFWNDNEEQIKGIFRSLPSRAAASFVCYTFLQLYNMDLLSFLRGGIWPQDRLSDADVNEINSYVNRLPKY